MQLTGEPKKTAKKNSEYCKFCYQDGAFVNPDMPLEEMKELVTKKNAGASYPCCHHTKVAQHAAIPETLAHAQSINSAA